MKISQLIVAAGIAAASFIGLGGVAAAAPMATACPSGVLTTVIDDNGVQHEACVDSAAPAQVLADVAPSSLQSRAVPARAELPATGKGTDGLIIAALLVGSGSVASLLSRRKADRP